MESCTCLTRATIAERDNVEQYLCLNGGASEYEINCWNVTSPLLATLPCDVNVGYASRRGFLHRDALFIQPDSGCGNETELLKP